MHFKLLKDSLKKAVIKLGYKPTDIVCNIAENPEFGDYTSNIALQLANQNTSKNKQSSIEIANKIVESIGHPFFLERVDVAGAGFLNFFLKDQELVRNLLTEEKDEEPVGDYQNYLVEYSQPNTHKPYHIGHFRNISIGESICRILEYQGHQVYRVTYGGDIGPHVAKALWGVLKLEKEYQAVKSQSLSEKAEFLGKAYVLGSEAYEKDQQAKSNIDDLNTRLYKRDKDLLPIWEETKLWSIAALDSFYSLIGVEFDREIWESEIEDVGAKLVKDNLGKVFIEDDGAIIFPGEKYGLHNRVFITSQGYPLYEAKELGVTQLESEFFPFDQAFHVVDIQQSDYFKVVTKAIELIDQKLGSKKKHVAYGFVSLTTGKMSSRKGSVVTAEGLIDQVKKQLSEEFAGRMISSNDLQLTKIAIGAIKFNYLKYSLLSDISFDVKKSVSLQGDSGPYLLYTFARIQSLLNRATGNEAGNSLNQTKINQEAAKIAQTTNPSNQKKPVQKSEHYSEGLEEEERAVLRQLEFFEAKVEQAFKKLQPNELAVYLLDLAKTFNLFYERYPILGSKKEEFRLLISQRAAEYLKLGLYLLGIETVDRM